MTVNLGLPLAIGHTGEPENLSGRDPYMVERLHSELNDCLIELDRLRHLLGHSRLYVENGVKFRMSLGGIPAFELLRDIDLSLPAVGQTSGNDAR